MANSNSMNAASQRKKDGFVSGIRARFEKWIDRRNPTAGEITLTQKRIFIFPSRAGAAFLMLVAGLLLGGINYENNMLFSLAFLLLSLFLVSILHTYSNLSGLTIKCGAAQPTFAGEYAEFEVVLSRTGQRRYEGLQLRWSGADPVKTKLIEGKQRRVSIFVPAENRGVLKVGRLLVETYYPLGLLRAWTWLDFGAKCMVYPRPEQTKALLKAVSASSQEGSYIQQNGSDDFAGYKDYVPGDSLKQVAWHNVARGLPMMSKHYQSQADHRIWVDWEQFKAEPDEMRLQRMCYLVLYADQQNLEYGVRLPGLEFPPSSTALHKLQCLQALALFRLPRAQSDKEPRAQSAKRPRAQKSKQGARS